MALRRMAKHRTPGPDEVPAQVLQLLDEDNLWWLAAVLGSSYQTKVVLGELVKADVENGDPRLFGNFRPSRC